MDADMDMDIPLPEELEWLETNAFLPEEDEEEVELYTEEEEDHQQQQQQKQQIPDSSRTNPLGRSITAVLAPESISIADLSPVSENQINGKKRLWSGKDNSADASSSEKVSSDEKRNRIAPPGSEIDEDWLRFSPPMENIDETPVVVEEEKFVSRFASEIDGDCIPVTGPSGDRVYAKMSRVERNDVSKKLNIKGYSYGLIFEPINDLMQRVEQEAFTKVLQASSESPSDLIPLEIPVVNEQLWVDKYAPNSFTELLSDEQTNREVLLLCGPPGLGKTTLAHIAAKHCGYRVINASDDRSSSTIEAKILDVVQMNSVMADSKPKCLVIDEIDGALGEGKGAVEVILKMVAAEKKSDVGKENVSQEAQSGRKPSKQRRKTASLSRPVICICNDLFAPSLRPLRQVAKLQYICNKERFRTSSIALTALAEYTECDIRSCLNTLQFLNKKKETINVLEISSQVVGRKDISRSAFDVWKEVFQKRKMKRERKPFNGCNSMSSDFDLLHSLISNRGDYELTLDGIHENILQLHYHDPLMQKTLKCLNSLGVSDVMHQYIMRTQKMSLRVYQPYIAITIRNLIAQVEKPNIEWPKSFQRYLSFHPI
ncbi:hypothetical protein HHK36_027033 [Tetracentron sinense]|uniref:AAA+ ATPase domain-containing protein n=1 Tax=Tetracentron sinense TaxID=13715 RepID=A0A835D561_TETSI|nr:hypothetical protein HHK36_027033 [Tetracentron sinense]